MATFLRSKMVIYLDHSKGYIVIMRRRDVARVLQGSDEAQGKDVQ